MSKFVIVYDTLYADADEAETVLAREFDNEHDLVRWLLRWSSTVQVLAISRSADFDYEDEVEK